MPGPSEQTGFFESLALLPAISQLDPGESARRFDELSKRISIHPGEPKNPEYRTALIDTGLQLQLAFARLAAGSKNSNLPLARHYRERAADIQESMHLAAETPDSQLHLIEQGSKLLPRMATHHMRIAEDLAALLLQNAALDPCAEPLRTRELLTQLPGPPDYQRYNTVILGPTPDTSHAAIYFFGNEDDIFNNSFPLPFYRSASTLPEMQHHLDEQLQQSPPQYMERQLRLSQQLVTEAFDALTHRDQLPTLHALAASHLKGATSKMSLD